MMNFLEMVGGIVRVVERETVSYDGLCVLVVVRCYLVFVVV